MPTHRHHIHIICDSKDSSLYALQDGIAVFFEEQCLSKDLFESGNSNAANYSWRCINRSDFVLVLIGQTYGKLNSTGVSQLHIGYLNAKTKNKPMAVLIMDNPDRPRQLKDLISIISGQTEHIYPITPNEPIDTILKDVYQQLINTKALPTPVAKAHHYQSTSKTLLGYSQPSPNQAQSLAKLADDLLLNCTAHAFQGGTLIETAFVANTNWQAILDSLKITTMAFSLQGLWRILNDIITSQAMPVVKALHPNVHAISRCQVAKADVIWVQEELLSLGWIAPIQAHALTKPAWRTTDFAKNLATQPTTQTNEAP